MRTTALLICLGVIAFVPAHAAEFEITGITGNGELTWVDTNTNGTYRVQWCPSLSETNWSSDWAKLTQIAAKGGIIRARIPMYFRVVYRPRQSQSANMCLVFGGGQPQGPQYDFYIGKYEILSEEFCEFLNNVQLNSGNERGANVYFAESGNAYMDASLNYPLFEISSSRLLYDKNAAIGTRYKVYPDYIGHPVTGMSWYGALKYCNWLTIREGRGIDQRCYSEGSNPTNWHPAHLSYAQWDDGFQDSERLAWVQNFSGFRLPMDQYTAKANYYNEFYKAAAWNGSSNVTHGYGRNTIDGQDANYFGSGDPFDSYSVPTTPAGYYDGSNHGGVFPTRTNANIYGVYDLSGNVWEWMTDIAAGSDLIRSARGGSWSTGSGNMLLTDMTGYDWATTCDKHYGFRVVSTAP